MTGWTYLIIYIIADMFVYRRFPKRVGNGFTGRIFKPVSKSGAMRSFVRYMVWFAAAWIFGLWPFYIFFPVAIAFVLDDYMFGDDDDLKRRWQAVKNSVKWKMKLPAPAPARSGTG